MVEPLVPAAWWLAALDAHDAFKARVRARRRRHLLRLTYAACFVDLLAADFTFAEAAHEATCATAILHHTTAAEVLDAVNADLFHRSPRT